MQAGAHLLSYHNSFYIKTIFNIVIFFTLSTEAQGCEMEKRHKCSHVMVKVSAYPLRSFSKTL